MVIITDFYRICFVVEPKFDLTNCAAFCRSENVKGSVSCLHNIHEHGPMINRVLAMYTII